jgi:S-adenosylmethionine-diacylgycerolhomoserine-N-methlytransferase
VSGAPLAGEARDHAALMDRVYRGQRHIYDLTRKYYLFGRDRTIAQMGCEPGDSVLEIACGTGRNLGAVAKRWPGVGLYGVDISSEMLRTAAGKLKGSARLAVADACSFDAAEALGREQFDRILLSYCLSMIPAWPAALDQAARLLAPGGSLHIVDFGDLGGLPRPLAAVLKSWLARFHVEPRAQLHEAAARVAALHGLALTHAVGPGRYYQRAVLRAPW